MPMRVMDELFTAVMVGLYLNSVRPRNFVGMVPSY
jgi:hypothetical protein